MIRPIALATILASSIGVLILTGCEENYRPDLVPRLAGCYVGSGELSGVVVRLETFGILSSGQVHTPYKIVELKDGPALLPEKIVYSRTGFGKKLVTGADGNFIPLSADLRSFELPFDSRMLTFTRTECGTDPVAP